MAQRVDGDACRTIQVGVAVGVVDPAALAVVEHERRADVGLEDVFLFEIDDGFGFRCHDSLLGWTVT